MGVICGVTTNPSLIAKEGGRSQEDVLKEIASIVDGPISGEVKATTVDAEGMIAEGREIAKLHENMVVKIPMTVEGLKACKALTAEGIKYKGVIYFGLMLTPDGPRVVEYNSRFGDPETQCILPRLDSDLIDIFNAVIEERLESVEIKWKPEAACCVVLASGGYPVKYETGYEIMGLSDAEKTGTILYHAGTKRENARFYSAGGRVLGVTGMGVTLEDAIRKAYEGASKISWTNFFYRKDIGKK